jgi:hypothetical protein
MKTDISTRHQMLKNQTRIKELEYSLYTNKVPQMYNAYPSVKSYIRFLKYTEGGV